MMIAKIIIVRQVLFIKRTKQSVVIFAYFAVVFVVRVLFKKMIQFRYFFLIYMIVFLQKYL